MHANTLQREQRLPGTPERIFDFREQVVAARLTEQQR
jgi:hypothetical protein